ncbi:hypothetical protein EDC18_1027 [Natranaerovirga pectinivora]|uniref:Uncharacterized protein n=1 Tax=Natranaerovirga pectinivora TaxID=682400 RepID=A0A4R3MM37_9FIRM|nr:hypothetical protein [Natranaerovirga pectinivora]TCT15993.1 hypothetical protein EDC18_1027 [Natranaerovirga pectinivora]
MLKKITILLSIIILIMISAGCSQENKINSNIETDVIKEDNEVKEEESDRVKEAKEVIYKYFEAEKERDWQEIIKHSEVREKGFEEHPYNWYKNPYEMIELEGIRVYFETVDDLKDKGYYMGNFTFGEYFDRIGFWVYGDLVYTDEARVYMAVPDLRGFEREFFLDKKTEDSPWRIVLGYPG